MKGFISLLWARSVLLIPDSLLTRFVDGLLTRKKVSHCQESRVFPALLLLLSTWNVNEGEKTILGGKGYVGNKKVFGDSLTFPLTIPCLVKGGSVRDGSRR